MLTFNEKIEKEKRCEENKYTIYFHMEGAFWRAYNWSAYLARMFPSKLSDENKLKPTKRYDKKTDSYVTMVGLRLDSFEKYFPGVIDDDKIFEINDSLIKINVESFFDNKDFSELEKEVKDWEEELPLSKTKKNKEGKLRENETLDSINDKTLHDIINEIIEYQIESSTLINSVKFLSHIKEMLIKIK